MTKNTLSAPNNPKSKTSNPQSLRVLMVEDSEDDTQLIIRELKKGRYHPVYERVETATAMKKALKEKQWDIILYDHKLPKFNAPSAIALLKETNIDIPLLIVSGAIGEETAIECMRLGAHDYIMKNNLSRLCLTIARELEEADSRTKRKRAEEALRRSEEKYRNIIESMQEGYFELDLAGNFTFVNDAECRNMGYPKEELIGMNNRQYQDETTAQKTYQLFIRLYRTGEPVKASDVEIIRKNGTKGFNEVSVSLIRDAEGKPIGFRGISRDITERKSAEEMLRQSEERYRTLVEKANEAIYVAQDGMLKFVNRAGLEIAGYSEHEITSKPFIEFIHPDDRAMVGERYLKRLRGEGFEPRYTFRFIAKNGDIKWLELGAALITFEGRPATLNFVTDIIERKQAEEALRESEEKYRMVVENAKEAIFVAQDVKLVFVNRASADMIGYSEEILTSKSFTDFIHPDDRNMVVDHHIKRLKGEEVPPVYSFRVLRQDGTVKWVELNAAIIQWKGRAATLNFLNDITERKQAEEALKKNREELIKKNQELEESKKNIQITLERLGAAYEELKTTQSKILQQEKMASVGQLAAGVAHEINNPMAFIASNLGTLDKYIRRFMEFIQLQSEVIESFKVDDTIKGLKKKRKELKLDYITEDVSHLIRESLDGSERVQKIVQGLDRFSRVDDEEYKDININDCIESSINIVWNELKHKATLHKDYGNLPQTKCYPLKLNQVFMNLLINAVQAIEKKGKIEIKTWEKDGSIWVTVSDTGCGIPQKNQNKIFEPFFTTKEVGKGTGLGLSISYEIMQRHKGEISFESKKGKGTTFTIRIPIV
jgi:two-component system NtrC family sensor kinase